MLNNSTRDIWVDMEGIDYEVYSADSLIEPNSFTVINLLLPEDLISKNGFALIRKKSRDTLLIHTSILNNYPLENNSIYCLKGYYKDPKSSLFKNVYKKNLYLGSSYFTICNE